jgi:membrane fusion protein, multidrug efflux system
MAITQPMERTCMNRPSLFVVLLTAALALVGCSKEETKAAASAPPPSVPVSVATVVQKDMPVIIRSIGNVEAIEKVEIKSQIAGQIVAVHFKEGDDVKKGQLLFEMDPRQPKVDLARAEGNLLRDQAQAKNARAQAERYSSLLKEGVVSAQEYDRFTSEAEAADAAVAADKAAVEQAKLQLTYTSIYAPVAGTTGNLMIKVGNIVKANEGTLVTINQITPIAVTFSIPEQQLADVKRFMNSGLKVEALLPGGSDQPMRGQLKFIDNAVDLTTGTIKLKGDFANTDRKLWPGQFVDIQLTLTTTSNAIVVPTQAVQTGQQGQYVFIVKPDMTADMRPVVVQRTMGQETVIQSGVQAGDRVVTDGHLRLQKGAKVEVKQSTNGGGGNTTQTFTAD